mmetsp:Transcript_2618/g.5837  ORF Transcript_2618/g.5837 Transcript_2618/m.5837 type:complete len:553 (+) Transcript_2618:152-1810(+)
MATGKAADLERELAELHSKYQASGGEKDSGKIIKKQKATIDKLKKDNDALRRDLDLDASASLRTSHAGSRLLGADSTTSNSAKMAKLQESAESFTRKIEAEKKKIEDLDGNIKELNAAVLEQRKKLGGSNVIRENNLKTQKQIKVLENRLDKSLLKFNEALAFNKQLREGIDNLRRERQAFDNIYKKLDKDLAEKKGEMQRIIEISNVAYEARDKAQQEMALLKGQADREQANFEHEWKELGKLIESDRKMKELLRQRDKAGIGPNGKLDDEDRLRKKIIRGNAAISKDKAAQQAALQKVQSYEEAFAKIQESTGISDIDELVTTFIEAEDKNFSLFNYVNELNNEVEKLEEQIAEIKGEIEKYKGQGGQNDRQRKKLLKDLEDRLASTEARAEQYEAKALKAAKTVSQLEHGIQSIFNKIGCDKSALSDMLGTTGVTESNMMQYLGIIEQRTNELLQLYHTHAKERGDAAEPVAVIGQGPAAPAGSTIINIDPPVIGDEDDSEDESDEDEERPLSRDELKAKTLRGLTKREGQQMTKQQKRKNRKGESKVK